MCDEERYADMYTDIRKVEEEEQLKRNKKAEIGFNYDADCKAEAAVESSSSEEEIEEPYVVPDGLKLPVGMDLPDTMKQSAIIEKTAMFVVNKGPQMEIVIKAKQRKNAVQFGFLEFDNKLNAFYKYICKLIRENKYTPVPVQPKMRPKAKKLRRLALEAAKKKEDEEANRRKSSALGMIALNHGSGSEAEENDEEDEDAGYLHPLLRSSTDVPPTDEGEPAFGPVQRPKQRSETPKQDFNELLMRLQSQVDNADNVYSSLYKNLNSIIPGSKPPQDDDGATNGFADETAQIDESRTEIIYETDEGKVAEYNEWYTSFYGRPSPYPPTELPVPLPPPPNLSSALSIAARYVAMNGGAAEQRLIDHNGDGCSFLLPSSPYYTYYQSRVRQNLWSLSQAYLASLSTNNNKSTEGDPSSSSIIFPAPPRPPSALSADALRLIPTEISTNEQKKLESVGEADFSEDDGLKQERKERARLFMEKILNEKLSAKKRSQENPTIAGNDVPSEKRAKTAVQSAVATASPIEVSRLTANSISELINEKIKNVFTASPLLAVAAESDSNKKSKKKSERVEASSRDSRHQRSRRSRSKRRSSSRSRRWSRTRSPRGRRSRSRSPSHNDSRHHRSHDKSHKSRTRSRRRSRSRSLRR